MKGISVKHSRATFLPLYPNLSEFLLKMRKLLLILVDFRFHSGLNPSFAENARTKPESAIADLTTRKKKNKMNVFLYFKYRFYVYRNKYDSFQYLHKEHRQQGLYWSQVRTSLNSPLLGLEQIFLP